MIVTRPSQRGHLLWRIAAPCLAVDGEFWECGVYHGDSAGYMADQLADHQPRTLRLFDTFTGLPPHGIEDAGCHLRTFADASLSVVQRWIPHRFVQWHVGLIPSTFTGLDTCRIAFAFVDLDLYRSTRDALDFIMPRLAAGGHVLVDDYGSREWPGVRQAVDEVAPTARHVPNGALIRGTAT